MRRIRRDGHDCPALLATKLRHRLLKQIERPTNVNRKRLLPLLNTQRIGGPHTQNTRRIDQHIQPLARLQDALTHLSHLFSIRHIQHFGGKRVVILRKFTIESCHLSTRFHKRQRGGVANPFSRAGYPDGFPCEVKS